jgi:hypothetical protein
MPSSTSRGGLLVGWYMRERTLLIQQNAVDCRLKKPVPIQAQKATSGVGEPMGHSLRRGLTAQTNAQPHEADMKQYPTSKKPR